jgi:hypothetical protein
MLTVHLLGPALLEMKFAHLNEAAEQNEFSRVCLHHFPSPLLPFRIAVIAASWYVVFQE